MSNILTSIKSKIKKYKKSKFWLVKYIYYKLKFAWHVFRLATDGRYRAERSAWLKSQKYHFQFYTRTAHNRYPAIFQTCAHYLRTNPQAKLLSFGCSTGEETRTLAEYMPQATVVGI